ncbi:putative C2 domain protein [Leishmania guyanensis]|uniref:C2 domain-containing protein n=1 Tax=Leishmania guyanensis TaxID=5670 RepID=A0A1E1J8S3_LEIGU|nr:hypothetical protein, conserved [Leishmania guyanensis]
MPSPHRSTSSPSRRTRTATTDQSSGFPIHPTRHSRHSRASTRRSYQESSTSYYDVDEARKEVADCATPANQVSPDTPHLSPYRQYETNSTGRGEQDRSDDAPQDYPRLTYHRNGSVSQLNQSILKLAGGRRRRTRRFGTVPIHPSSRYVSVTNRDVSTPHSRKPSKSSAGRHATDVHPSRASRMVEFSVDIETLEDYKTPIRRHQGGVGYVYDHGVGHTAAPLAGRVGRHDREDLPTVVYAHSNGNVDESKANSTAAAALAEPYHFRVRLCECQGVFADLEALSRTPPAVYFAVHTVKERGHSGVVEKGSYNPVFCDEFMFSSADPEQDALVCTLVSVSSVNDSRGGSMQREKKVAECVLALHNLAWQVERKVWVPLVRHPGTSQAYEQGEVLVSIYSADFGYDDVATEAEEAACSTAIHDILTHYAPQELHRLDWMTGAYVNKGPEALSQLRASYRARTIEPVPVRVTVQRIDGLTDEAGCPTRASDIYVVVGDGCVEQLSKTVLYRRGAIINQEFDLVLLNPAADTVSVTVFGNSRKLGEAVAGLTNIQAGKAKEVKLMLVRAAETGDASNGGQATITLQTEKYSSPRQMTAMQETRLRNRVLAYLWRYLRDDLHRLDAIVGRIDNEEVYMQEWARAVGPEQKPTRLTVRVREARNMFSDGGLLPRCYARISAGPATVRTGLATVRKGLVTFSDTFSVQVYDPAHDAVEVMIVADGDDGECEVSRVCFGVANLPRQRCVVRTLHLVAAATKRVAHVQGELTVELVAEDFGLTGALAVASEASIGSSSSLHMQRLEVIIQQGTPEKLHRVPYMLDTAPPGECERFIEDQEKQYGAHVAVAPMTVKILGVKAFKPVGNFYVKVYLNKEPILRTEDVKGSTEVVMNIEDNNETTVRLKEASQTVLFFKIGQHRALRKTAVLGETEVALANLVRGEKNVLWLPFFHPSTESASGYGGGTHLGSISCVSVRQNNAVKLKGNRMPDSNGIGTTQQQQSSGAALAHHGAATPSPEGLLGMELQSLAFPATTVTEYKLDDESGRRGVSVQEAVTYDMTSLIAKMRPSELTKVQPRIAQCASLKSAHDELRAELSRTPIAATIYVNIESVELATEAGKAQEAQGRIAVEAVYGSERQRSCKRTEFANDALHQRQCYTQIRLDIPEKLNSTTNGHNGATSRAAGDAKGVPPLELRLVGVHRSDWAVGAVLGKTGSVGSGGAFDEGGRGMNHYDATDSASDTTADSCYVGGENNIHSYIKRPKYRSGTWAIKRQKEGRVGCLPNTPILPRQHSSRTGVPTVSSYSNHCQSYAEVQHSNYCDVDEEFYLSDAKTIRSYVDSPWQSRQQSAHCVEWTLPRHHSGQANLKSITNYPSSMSLSATTASVPYNSCAPCRGEIGAVCLSLRALLTKPLYKIGETLRVPIVLPSMATKLSHRGPCSPEVNRRCVVGHVTLRLTLPAFESIPESLRLGSHHVMSKVMPSYVHYYERRIGAYMRSHNAAGLVSLHYNLYERDVASGCWPVSLHGWMQALIKRFGPETDSFGPEPPLPFDPEEWKRARQCSEVLRREREEALTLSEKGSEGATLHTDKHSGAHCSHSVGSSAYLGGNSPNRVTAAGTTKRSSSANGRPDAATAPAEAEHSF